MTHLLNLIALLLALAALPAMAAPSSDTKTATRRVLILYSQDKWHPAHELTEQRIREVFSANPAFDIQLSAEYLDLARHHGPDQIRAMADFLRRKYRDTALDAIISVYPAALDFLTAGGAPLFPGVPIVAAEISPAVAEKLDRSPSLRRLVTGSILGENVTGLLADIFRLRPTTRHLALIAGTTPNDSYSEQIFRNGLRGLGGTTDLIDLTGLPMADTLARVAALPPDTAVLFSTLFRDGAGKTFVPREALQIVSRAANAPVYGLYDSYLGSGMVGGHLSSFALQGREAALLTLRILAGEAPETIPWGGANAYINAYDWRELQRWGIPATLLPADGDLRYYTPTFWEQHRPAIIGVAALVVIETVLLIVLVITIRQRRRAEQELAILAGRLINNQEEELCRLSRELHDDLTQKLAALSIDAGLLEKAAFQTAPALGNDLQALKNSLITVSNEVHRMARQLHPAVLDELGLVQTARIECADFSRRTGVDLTFTVAGEPAPLAPDVALCLYRILQEALQNMAKHARTGEAHVALEFESGCTRLSIQDFGIGFDARRVTANRGIGLSSMRERVRLVNGGLTIESEPGEGTEIRVTIPTGGSPP